MNEQQALAQFVQANLELLTAREYSRDRVKSAQRQFFVDKHNKKYGIPGVKQINTALLAYLRLRGISADRLRTYLDECPIFREAGDSHFDHLYESLETELRESLISQVDIETIKLVGAVEAAKQTIESEVEAEVRGRLNAITEEIERKEAEYASLPSILEQDPVEEPSFDPKLEENKRWWERFYLRGDPFPRKDGLSEIREELYESVLLKTSPFENTLSALTKNPRFLFHTGFLLVGDYGCGKTTFIDYLSYYLVHHLNILPLRIISKAYSDSTGFADHFHLKLRIELQRECEKKSLVFERQVGELDIEEQIIELARQVTSGRLTGIVVFLDDYHKHTEHFPQVFQFLGSLQILKDSLARADVNVGFVVSGTVEWLRRLKSDGQMAGFLDNTPIEMPAITPSHVCDVFNLRIAAFCQDQSPRRIREEFVDRIFREVNGKGSYRDYLNRIVSELASNNFAIIDTPIDIPDSVVNEIRNEIERDPALKSSIHKIVHLTRFQQFTDEQIGKCLELLIQVALQDGITEDDRLFVENRYYFQQLRDASLIQKARTHVSSSRPSLRWVIHSRLKRAIDVIDERYHLKLNDYLFKAYARRRQALTEVRDLADDPIISRLRLRIESARDKIPKPVLDKVSTALVAFDSVRLKGQAKPSEDQFDRGLRSFEQLSLAFFDIDGSARFFRSANITDLKHQWRLHWHDSESIGILHARVDDFRTDKTAITLNLALKQLREVFIEIADTLHLLIEDMVSNTSPGGGLLTRNVHHTGDELGIFNMVRESYFSARREDHFDYVKRTTDYLETRMRSFLYATTSLLYGKDYENCLPPEERKYAHRSLASRHHYGSYVNAFDGMVRPQFRNIFLTGGRVKEQIVDCLRSSWQTRDWALFFDMFIEENIATAHQKHSTYDVGERDRYLDYCRLAETFMSYLNTFVGSIVSNYSYLIHGGDDQNDVGSYLFKYMFKTKKDEVPVGRVFYDEVPGFIERSQSEAFTLYKPNYLRVTDLLREKSRGEEHRCVVEDLMDVEYLTNNYNVPFVDFVNALVFAQFVDRSIRITQWFGSSVLIRVLK